jgi:hypothetical protein
MNNFFVKNTFSKSIIFKVKNTFEPKVFKSVLKIIFTCSNHFSLLIINVKILSNFQNEWCTFGRKNDIWKKIKTIHFWGLNALDMQKHFKFVSSFEHVIFAINEKYYRKNYDSPNYYVSLMIFQTYKNVVLNNVYSLGWLLLIVFLPIMGFIYNII